MTCHRHLAFGQDQPSAEPLAGGNGSRESRCLEAPAAKSVPADVIGDSWERERAFLRTDAVS